MTFESQIDPRSENFKGHRNDMLEALKLVQDAEAAVRSNSNSKRKKFHGRGQLLPRERLALLLDPNSRVLELCGLAGFKMHDDDGAKSASGGGAIACIGQVEGVRCAIYVHDSAIKGGAVSPMGVQKALRLQEVALENRLPMITLAESAGGNLNYQSELFVPGGRTFANQAKISAAGIPQITVVHGSSTAGGAYVPGLSDYVIMVRKKAKVFLAGPRSSKPPLAKIPMTRHLAVQICMRSIPDSRNTSPTMTVKQSLKLDRCSLAFIGPSIRSIRRVKSHTIAQMSFAAWSP